MTLLKPDTQTMTMIQLKRCKICVCGVLVAGLHWPHDLLVDKLLELLLA